MTIVPNLMVTGILAVVLSLSAAVWAAGFVQRKYGGPVLILLSIAMLLVGSGFIPTFVAVIASVAASGIHAPLARWRTYLPQFVAVLWPWPIVAYLAWVFPVQWLLGQYLEAFLLKAGMLLFLLFDLGLPALAVLTALAHDTLKTERTSI
jgi:hypothetical protein